MTAPAARAWLELLYRDAPGFVSVVGLPGAVTRFYRTDDLERAARTVAAMASRLNVYTGTCPLRHVPAHGRGTAGDVGALVALWADLDVAGGIHGASADGLPLPPDRGALGVLLEDLGLSPSAIVDSAGGLQAWWLLEEPWVLEDDEDRRRAASLSLRWSATLVELGRRRGWHVDAVGDLPRILRVPGTHNHKFGPPKLVELVSSAPERRYTTSELASVLVEMHAPSRPAGLHASRTDHTEGPADVFARVVSWRDLLEPAGWTLVRERGGVGYWRHPSATAEHSATTDAHRTPTLVNFSPNAGLPVGPGHKLTKFRVWAHLHFGGDEGAAARALRALGRRGAR
jgi:hypothetical protein